MKPKNFLIFSLFLIFTALLNAACVEQKASQANSSSLISTENKMPEDREISAALALIEKTPDAPEAYNKLAVLYIRKARETGDFSLNTKAENAVSRALEIAPSDTVARKLQASLHLTFHRFRQALESGAKLEKDFPNDPFVYGVLTDANIELGNYPAAVEAGQKMISLRPDMTSYARAGLLRSLNGDHEGAVEMLKLAARTADPLDKEAQSWCLVQLGNELWENGKYEQAEKVYDEALQNFPNYHLAIAGKGRARAAQGDLETAVKFLTEANNRVPSAETAILLGDIYAKQGNTEKAGQQYALVEVIEQKIGSSDDQKRLALLWADHDQKLDEALAVTEREHQLRKDIFTADALAWALYKKGKFQEAKKASAEAMRLQTNNARIFYHAGMIEKELGNRAAAKRFLEKALKLNPAFDLLQAEKAKIALRELS